jgi:FkbM family methyltransferase
LSIRTDFRDLLAKFPLLDGLFRRLIWSRIHFPEIEMRFIDSLDTNSIDIAIDVGAAKGSYAWILNRKSRQVFAFEPGEMHGRYLERTIFGTKILLVKAAVGSTCSRVSMYTPGSDSDALHSATLSQCNPIACHIGTMVRQVDQVTLDSLFIDKLDIGRSADVLKVDVEGYELEVFKGAQALIARHHPLIFCEIEKRHNAECGKVFQLLRAADYKSYVFQEGSFLAFNGDAIDHLQPTEALKIRLDGSYNPAKNLYINNFVFQHPQSRIKVTK